MCSWINHKGAEDGRRQLEYEMETGLVSSFGFSNETMRHPSFGDLQKTLRQADHRLIITVGECQFPCRLMS